MKPLEFISKFKDTLSVVVILVGFGAWLIEYQSNFATKAQIVTMNIDNKLSHTELQIAIYELHGIETLKPEEKAKYEREVSRYNSLMQQRDKMQGL